MTCVFLRLPYYLLAGIEAAVAIWTVAQANKAKVAKYFMSAVGGGSADFEVEDEMDDRARWGTATSWRKRSTWIREVPF